MKINSWLKYFLPLSVVSLVLKLNLVVRFLFSRKKLTTSHDFEEPFFIIGYGRSGNTLLRSMLISGEEVSIPPESYVLPRLIKLHKKYNFLPWSDLTSIIVGEFEAYPEFFTWEIDLINAKKNIRNLPTSKQTLSHIINEIYKDYTIQKHNKYFKWGDKTPVNLRFIDKLLKVYPNAKFIYIKRNPKDAISSALNSNIYKDLNQALYFYEICHKKINFLRKHTSVNQIIEVNYEDLVSKPIVNLQHVCDFLNISYSEKMLEFWNKKNELGDVNVHEHHNNIGNPLNTKSIGKWKKFLTENQVIKIDKRLNKLS